MTSGPVRIARGAWVSAEQADDLAGRCAAVLGTSAEDTVVASVTAARLHGLWLPPSLDARMHVATVTAGAAGRLMTRGRRPEVVAHRFQLRPEDVVTEAGLGLTSVARTWRDLASVLSLPDLVAAGDSALRTGTSVEQLVDVLEASSRRHNARRAHAALALLDARSRSRPESHLRVAVSGADMPAFDVNMPVYRRGGGWLAEPDLSLAEARIALEYQGEDHADVRRMRRDITRFTDMRLDRWLVLTYGPAEVFGRAYLIKPEVYQHIRERAPGLLPRRTRPAKR